MRCDRLTTRSVSIVVAVLLSGGLVGCYRGPQVVTSIVFDGETRSITSADVVCTKQVNGDLLILVAGHADADGASPAHAAGPTRRSEGRPAL
jgi:hypothetical protein